MLSKCSSSRARSKSPVQTRRLETTRASRGSCRLDAPLAAPWSPVRSLGEKGHTEPGAIAQGVAGQPPFLRPSASPLASRVWWTWGPVEDFATSLAETAGLRHGGPALGGEASLWGPSPVFPPDGTARAKRASCIQLEAGQEASEGKWEFSPLPSRSVSCSTIGLLRAGPALQLAHV